MPLPKLEITPPVIKIYLAMPNHNIKNIPVKSKKIQNFLYVFTASPTRRKRFLENTACLALVVFLVLGAHTLFRNQKSKTENGILTRDKKQNTLFPHKRRIYSESKLRSIASKKGP